MRQIDTAFQTLTAPHKPRRMIPGTAATAQRMPHGGGYLGVGAGTVAPMGDIGTPELLIILAVVVLIFGGAKLPQLARSLGEAQKEFRKSSRSDDTPATGGDTTK